MSIHVLLADDDPDDRLIFANALKEIKMNTHIDMVKNGKELMEYLSRNATLPDIVFLDLNMPGKDGKECLNELRENERLKELCIGIYTISRAETDIEQARSVGAAFYVSKPSNFYELKKTLHKVLKTKPPFEKFLQN
jgi:CheY-like chemotaxis protein